MHTGYDRRHFIDIATMRSLPHGALLEASLTTPAPMCLRIVGKGMAPQTIVGMLGVAVEVRVKLTHTHTYIHTHTRTLTHTHTYTHTYTYIHTYIHTHALTHTYIHTHTNTHKNKHTHIHTGESENQRRADTTSPGAGARHRSPARTLTYIYEKNPGRCEYPRQLEDFIGGAEQHAQYAYRQK
jgi:hypothetical protein